MINFIFGAEGTGKTAEIIKMIGEDCRRGVEVFLVVPDQEALAAERRTLTALPPEAQLSIEVLSFSRLYNRVCREYGGLSYKYITAPMKNLLMWKNLSELSPMLCEYRVQRCDMALTRTMLREAEELKSCSVTPEALEAAAMKLPEGSHLRGKLLDISLIYGAYSAHVTENYSDSSDDMSRLYDLLRDRDFFDGRNVYIDSFTSFTGVEHRVIEAIFASADNVTVSVPLASPEDESISSESIRRSLLRLRRAAEGRGGYRDIILSGDRPHLPPCLDFISKNLYRLSARELTPPEADGSVVMEVCPNIYSEAEMTASHILELLRSGERCRDILVLVRDPEKYRGIIEQAFERADIPYFLSEKTDICSLPPVKLILTALKIKQYSFRGEDVVSYIKTGLCGISDSDGDMLEDYIKTWGIRGERFTEGAWTMNPDGYTDRLTARGEAILEAANRAREMIIPPLQKLFVLLDSSENIADMCRHIYDLLLDISLEDRLLALAESEARRGDAKAAEEYRAIFGIILETLANVGEALGEEEADPEELATLLRAVFSETRIGTIPTSVDQVLIGSAAMIRGSSPKYTFVLGLCEGEFPAAVSDSSLLDSADRAALTGLGIELSGDSESRSSDELMFALRAISTPALRLYLSYYTSGTDGQPKHPSLPYTRIKKLLGLTPHRYSGADIRYLAGSPLSAMSYARGLEGAEGEALRKVLSETVEGFGRYSEAKSSEPECVIDRAVMERVLQDRIYLSPSSLEKYAGCPMSYFGTYMLGLRERKDARLKANDMGSFIHYLLEKLLPRAVDNSMTDEELATLAERVAEDYIRTITPSGYAPTAKQRHLYSRLKTLAGLLLGNILKEFSESDFTPAFFELSTKDREMSVKPWELTLNSGHRVTLSGTVDRVDILRKDSELYLRVVDYKTGSKSFSLSDLSLGFNTQMLLYLFTLCREENGDFHRTLGLEAGKTPIPCGVIYLDANVPQLDLQATEDEESIRAGIEKELKRSGLILNDADIVKAMNRAIDPRFLAGIKVNKEGELTGNALISHEGFHAVYQSVEETIRRIAESLEGGKCHASPLPHGKEDPCRYCALHPMCRV